MLGATRAGWHRAATAATPACGTRLRAGKGVATTATRCRLPGSAHPAYRRCARAPVAKEWPPDWAVPVRAQAPAQSQPSAPPETGRTHRRHKIRASPNFALALGAARRFCITWRAFRSGHYRPACRRCCEKEKALLGNTDKRCSSTLP
jgi:hypothetical protein